MLHCFDNNLNRDLLDRQPFKFSHRLIDHPALGLDNLGRVLPTLKEGQIFYSKSTRNTSEDLDRLHLNQKNELSIEETIHSIQTSDSYIMVRSPETDPSFADLYRALLADVDQLVRDRRSGKNALDAMLYMFIASPNSVTPFHIDRYSTLLMQFRGNKTVTVFPPLDKRVVNTDQCEDYVAHCAPRGPQWNPEAERYGTTFDFAPGEAIHIPFVAGHHVRNGPQDVSISLSIIFKTAQTERMRKAMSFNRKMRPLLSPFGMVPTLAGQSAVKDAVKAALFAGAHRVSRALRSRQ
jgi:hypothetical protein